MRYSNYPFKTRKDISSQEVSKSAIFLQKAGFFEKNLAGIYSTLPFGLNVSKKIENIIRKNLNKHGALELILNTLQDPKIWEKSGRFDDEVIDVWFKTELKNKTVLGLANTHEEPITDLVSKFLKSYKDLPIALYQFQTKLRNELRAKNGILRTREFVMKDLYTFNKDESSLDNIYEIYKQAYVDIFNELGVGNDTFITFASGGSFCKYSHEFQLLSETGEDTIYVDFDKKIAINKEVYNDEVINELGLDKNNLVERKSIEVANIFKLKTIYSEPLKCNFADEDNKNQFVYMGCYGIGIGRTLASIVEVHNDDNGIIWPKDIAPYQIHLVNIGENEFAESLYNELLDAGYEVLWDDRDVRPGVKFTDCDLIGNPLRVVVSSRLKESNQFELKYRNSSDVHILSKEELLSKIQDFYAN
ncbi:prolyl-tRNA synthetase [bacterium]|jgi:prolyl-tRNA synthetase|nr:prolyl-tRNA synthetase [bacterium]MBT6293823.1 prolyl-tRNA synthetase [bacterium]